MGGLGCDNMTAIIICLLQGGSYKDLASRCSERAIIRRDLSPNLDAKRVKDASYSGLRDALYGREISEEDPHNFGVVPSKLNDTISSANTDLDIEIRRLSTSSSKDGEDDDQEDNDLNSPGPDDVDSIGIGDNVSHESKLDIFQPIETTV